MRKLRCYTDQELQTDKTIELDEHSAHHLRTVLRASTGQNIEFFNGNGNNYDAELTAYFPTWQRFSRIPFPLSMV